ncbi:MAG TPA: hypothetical protein V6C69_12680 [Trichormus sp.]|jgi:hypothetical protein
MKNKKMLAALTTELRAGFRTIKDGLSETNQHLNETNERLDRLAERVDRGFNGLGLYLMELEKHHDARLKRLEERDLER